MKVNYLLILITLFSGCRDEYVADFDTPPTGYLVVEGMINSGLGNTTIRLSRTSQLPEVKLTVVTGANVALEDEQNNIYQLTGIGQGNYTRDNLNLDAGRKYRLKISANSKEYLSDWVPVHSNPPIDSVTWTRNGEGVRINVNSNDPANQTRYYNWQFEETWEFHSAYVPNTKYVIDLSKPIGEQYMVDFVNPVLIYQYDSSLFRCWKSDTSRNFLLASTARYTLDTISMPIHQIEPSSWKLSEQYSILVKQYGLTKEAYDFLQKMKKNSDELGGIFNGQPSELRGNIKCVDNPDELVIGFVSICPVQVKRIFISNAELPGWNYTQNCELKEQNSGSENIRINNFSNDGLVAFWLPVEWLLRSALPMPNGVPTRFTIARTECVDCRIRGTTAKPVFWP